MKQDIELITRPDRSIDYDPDVKMSKETRQAMLHIVLELLDYYQGFEFVDWLEKSGRVDYVINNLRGNVLPVSEYASCLASLRDWYGDWLCGMDPDDDYYLPPPKAKKSKK